MKTRFEHVFAEHVLKERRNELRQQKFMNCQQNLTDIENLTSEEQSLYFFDPKFTSKYLNILFSFPKDAGLDKVFCAFEKFFKHR